MQVIELIIMQKNLNESVNDIVKTYRVEYSTVEYIRTLSLVRL